MGTFLPPRQEVYKVKVLVKDDHQGWASQEFDLTLGNSVTAKREGP